VTLPGIDQRAGHLAERDGEVLENVQLSPRVHRLAIRAERIARVRRPGRFVIVRLGPGAERIPLTIADADSRRVSISLLIQAVGTSTRKLVALSPSERICDVAGPLGRPTAIVVGFGVSGCGSASATPPADPVPSPWTGPITSFRATRPSSPSGRGPTLCSRPPAPSCG
jgi:hypothetical protein